MDYIDGFLKIYLCVLLFILGSCMASFLACVAARRLEGESLWGHSHCDFCGHELGLPDLVPVLSYVFLRGKCRHCGAKLSSVYMLGELAGGVLFVLVFLKYGLAPETIEGLLFICILELISFADLYKQIIPNEYIIAGLIIRAVFILISVDIAGEAVSALLGGFVIAGALLLIVLLMERILKKEAMGGGDIKLIFMTGAFLGIICNFLGLFIAAISGIMIMIGVLRKKAGNDDKNAAFAFGPFIAFGAAVSYIFGSDIVSAYLGLF